MKKQKTKKAELYKLQNRCVNRFCQAILSPQEVKAYGCLCENCWIGDNLGTTSHPAVTKVKKVRTSGIKDYGG